MRVVHVVSDISISKGLAFGAYSIGGEKPTALALQSRKSTDAEMEACAAGIVAAHEYFRQALIEAHIDVAQVFTVLRKHPTNIGAQALHEALEKTSATLSTDARGFPMYAACHHAARAAAGCFGTEHPLSKVSKKLHATATYERKVLRIQVSHGLKRFFGVTSVALAAHLELPLGKVVKELKVLRSNDQAWCEQQPGPSGCDERQIVWYHGRSFGESVGRALREAGVCTDS